MIWARHIATCRTFCAVTEHPSTYATACGGSFAKADEDEFQFHDGALVAASERCGACERVLCERGPVERGLRELEAVTRLQDVPAWLAAEDARVAARFDATDTEVVDVLEHGGES